MSARDLGEVVARTWRENRLFSVLLELTYRCNLDCFFCYNDLGLEGEPLSTERYLELLEELAELGVLHLTLSGGEPLAHPDFFRLGAAARELGFVTRVKTNGHALRGELLRRLVEEMDPFRLEISLHGATAATHERQTRVAGSFERLLANLREMIAAGLAPRLHSTLTAYNEGEIEAMFALADDLGLRLRFDPDVTPRDDGDRSPLAIAPSRRGLERLFRLEAERARAAAPESEIAPAPPPRPDTGGKHCGAGSAGAAVDPFGNVYPCVQWRRPVGNLRRQSMAEIWAGGGELEAVRRLSAEVAGRLATTADAPLLNFCPGAAAAHTGDPLALYPAARLRRQVLREPRRREEPAEEARRPLLPVIR